MAGVGLEELCDEEFVLLRFFFEEVVVILARISYRPSRHSTMNSNEIDDFTFSFRPCRAVPQNSLSVLLLPPVITETDPTATQFKGDAAKPKKKRKTKSSTRAALEEEAIEGPLFIFRNHGMMS